MKKSTSLLITLGFLLSTTVAIGNGTEGNTNGKNTYIGAMPLSYDLNSSLSNGVFMARATTIAMLKISTITNGKLSIPAITDAGKQKTEADYLLTSGQSSNFVTPEVSNLFSKAKYSDNPIEKRKAENLWLANEDNERLSLEKSSAILFPLKGYFGKYDAVNEEYSFTLESNQTCELTIEESKFGEKPRKAEHLCIEYPNLTLNMSPFKKLKVPVAEAEKLNVDYPYFFGVLVYAECDISNMTLINAKKKITKKWVTSRDLNNTILMSCPVNRIHLINHREQRYQLPISVTRTVIASFEAQKIATPDENKTVPLNSQKNEIQKKVDQFQNDEARKPQTRKAKTKTPQEINF
jgi:hypothetical protein